jgi:hypothetical protein
MTVPKQPSVHHTISPLKFAKKNPTIRRVIYGAWAAYSMKW